MTTRILALIALSGATLLLTACGDGGRTISVDAGAKALRTAGFSSTKVQRHVEIATGLEGEIDDVDVRAFPAAAYRPDGPLPRGWPRAALIDFDSPRRAARFVMTLEYQHCRRGLPAWRARRTGCPTGYTRSKVLSYRICNVILWSYNEYRDPALTARVQRASRLLRAMC